MLDDNNRKAINFDLYEKELLKVFSNTGTPYSKIKKFMLDNGFEHRQYSGYVSKEPMTTAEIAALSDKLYETFDWLYECVNKLDVTSVNDLSYGIKRDRSDLKKSKAHNDFMENHLDSKKIEEQENIFFKNSRKAINFDLFQGELLKVFKDTRIPYSQIKKFMLDNGFEHRQYSGYVSKEPMTTTEIIALSKKLYKTFDWLYECVNKLDVTSVNDLNYSIKKYRNDLDKSKNPGDLQKCFSNFNAFSNEYKNATSQDEIKNIENKYGMSAIQFEFLEKERKELQAKAIEELKANKVLENSSRSIDKER